MKTIKQIKQENEKYKTYYRYTCQKCNETIIFTYDEIELIKFQPYEKEISSWKYTYDEDENGKIKGKPLKMEEIKQMILVSSDRKKDYYKLICPVCNEEIHITPDELYQARCDRYGEKTLTFKLDQDQLELFNNTAKKDWEEYKNENPNLRIDAMHMIWTYTFVPGGVGTITTVENNYTHKKYDLTDIDKW